jgi:hypothetical protein
MSNEDKLNQIIEQLACICKRQGVEFFFVGGINLEGNEKVYRRMYLDGDTFLAQFMGQAIAKLFQDMPDFAEIVLASFIQNTPSVEGFEERLKQFGAKHRQN